MKLCREQQFFGKLKRTWKMVWVVFPSASGKNTVSGRTENPHTFDRFSSELETSVVPRSTDVPVRPRCTLTLPFGSSNETMCVLTHQKCGGGHGRAQKLYCLISMLSMQPCIESGTLSLRKRASRTVKVFSGFMHSSAVFRGCSGQQSRDKCAQ